MINVLIAEDQAMFRSAIKRLLEMEGDIAFVGEVARGDQVLEAALRTSPDVVLLDIEMPGLDGLAAAQQLTQRLPTCRSLIVTTFGRPGFLQRALASGASGFVLKDDPPEALAAAIRRCARGEKIIDPELAAAAMRLGPSPLTDREREVLRGLAIGRTNKEIARSLGIALTTVKSHVRSILDKLGVDSRTQAALHAVRSQILSPDELQAA